MIKMIFPHVFGSVLLPFFQFLLWALEVVEMRLGGISYVKDEVNEYWLEVFCINLQKWFRGWKSVAGSIIEFVELEKLGSEARSGLRVLFNSGLSWVFWIILVVLGSSGLKMLNGYLKLFRWMKSEQRWNLLQVVVSFPLLAYFVMPLFVWLCYETLLPVLLWACWNCFLWSSVEFRLWSFCENLLKISFQFYYDYVVGVFGKGWIPV